MSLAERVPGLVPGRPLWNLFALLFGYIGAFYITIPLAVGWKLKGGTDNETLHRLPGVSAEGGLLTGAAATVYGGVAMVTLLIGLSLFGAAAGPPPETEMAPVTPAPTADGGAPETVTPRSSTTPTMTPTPVPASTPTATQTRTATDTAAPTETATAEPTPTLAPTPTPTPIPEPTPTPTPAPTPSPTPTPTPAPTPNPTPESTPEPTSTPSSDTAGETVTVVEVVDGDTFDIRFENGTHDTVRLLGVDTPETYVENTPEEFEGVSNTDAGADCLARWGEEATQHVRAELQGEQVRITFDENEPRRGYYGRLLVYIHVDGFLFNRQLVADGYGRVYSESDFTKKQRFLNTEGDAQENLTGLWACRNVESATETPSSGGSDESAVEIETVHADAAGDEYENLDDEYVVVTNTGDEPVDMGGWTLSDEANHVYTVPDGFTLEPGESVRIITGSGTNSESELYWGQEAPVWNNDGDTATLENEDGEEVDSYQYG